MAYDLTNLYISQSYKQILQVSASTVTDGTGSLISTLYLNGDKVITQTNIAAISATTASIAALNTFTGSAVYRSGSFTGSFTGSFLGSIVSASYAFTASSAVSSSRSITSSFSISSSYAFTASSAVSSSYTNLSATASYVLNSVSASYAIQALSSSYALTASYALNGGSGGAGGGFPVTGSAQITGSLGVTGSINATSITSSLFGTSSWAVSASRATSASIATTASYAVYATTAGNVALSGQIAPSGSLIGASQSPLNLFAGAGLTVGSSPALLTINIPGLTGKTLGTNAFISAIITGSLSGPGSPAGNYIAVFNLAGNGNITFFSEQATQFTFTGIYF